MDRISHHDRNTEKFEPPIGELAAKLHFEPTSEGLFVEAITHSSYANEHRIASNERLEFLGDSVMGLVVCEFLYRKFPDSEEGKLSKLKSILVSAGVLASFSKQMGLDPYLRLGQGELKTNGRGKLNILADLFEAFVGAYFLNFGFEATRGFILPLIRQALPEVVAETKLIDAKSSLQELLQARGLKPEYRTISESGPPHDRWFTVEVYCNEKLLGTGTGRTLKEAQNQAARVGMERIKS